ncbi:hypothetical protein ACTXT7_017453 [Hymenolepis weldensis]
MVAQWSSCTLAMSEVTGSILIGAQPQVVLYFCILRFNAYDEVEEGVYQDHYQIILFREPLIPDCL